MRLFLITIFLSVYTNINAQGIIVNETSNGTSGSKEFVELLVVGSTSNPTTPVDLNGWVFDDNNGEFEASTGTGVAPGHYRFVGTSPFRPGDLIVVYNSSDLNGNIIGSDENDSNNDGVYFFPINSSFIERCGVNPSSTNGISYTPCTYTSSPTQTWNGTGYRNGGDASQVRKPDYSFYHGFSYGDVLSPFPTFPTEFGGGVSFNILTGSGTGRNYYLDCGDWTLKTNYQRGDALFDTPGLPNTGNNSILINNIRNGSFNYDNLGDPINCALILNNDVLNLRYEKNYDNIRLEWFTEEEFESYNIYHSVDGIYFSLLTNTEDKNFTQRDIVVGSYYKVSGVVSEEETYSNIVYVGEFDIKLNLYPNPSNDIVNILTTKHNFKYIILYNSVGKKLMEQNFSKKIDVKHLDSGVYLLILSDGSLNIKRTFIKN
jgi:hypothetical protein